MSSGSPLTGPAAEPVQRPRGARRPAPRALPAAVVRLLPWLAALAVYVVGAVVVTWPAAAGPAGTVFGAPGDSTGIMTLIRYRNDLGVGPLSNASTPDENAPFGLDLPGAVSLPQVVVEAPMQALARVTGSEALAFNLAVMAGLVLSALACFALCRHVTGSWWASGVGGVAYGFSPWILERAHGHVHLTHLWSLPLLVLGLLMVRRRGDRWAWLLVGTAMVLALHTHTYFALFVATILAAFIIADVGAGALARRRAALLAAVSRGCFALAIYVAAMLPQGVTALAQGDRVDALLEGTRSPQDLITYGSRWHEWLVPSYRHPVFADWTGPFRAARLHESNPGETALYLGVVAMALAALGLAVAAARRRRPGGPGWPAGLALALVLCGVVVSLPRTVPVLGIDVPAPSALVAQAFDGWRVYARLHAVVMLGVAVLAAIGVAWMLRRLPRPAAPAVAAALAALVAFDLAVRQTSFPAAAPPVYDLVAAQPGDDPRVEYPLTAPSLLPHLRYIYFTEAAGRPLMNGGRAQTFPASLDGRLQDPSSPWTAPGLATLGVRWAVVHPDAYGEGPPEIPGMRPVGEADGALLYEVTAPPAGALAAPGDGFGLPEPTSEGRYVQWLQRRRGTIGVVNPGAAPREVTLRFSVASFHRPRVTVVRHDGRELVRARVGSEGTSLVARTTAPPGTTSLDIESDVGPEPVEPVLGVPDPRSVSLRVSGVRVDGPGLRPFRLG